MAVDYDDFDFPYCEAFKSKEDVAINYIQLTDEGERIYLDEPFYCKAGVLYVAVFQKIGDYLSASIVEGEELAYGEKIEAKPTTIN